jgi:glycine cleavage system aminomethyltransferase T
MTTASSSGPRSRDLVALLGLDLDLADEALPHMAFADGSFDGATARLARVSFTGDRSYEVSVPKRQGEYVGKRSLFTENALRPDRQQGVGLTVMGDQPLPTGAHAVEPAGGKRRSIGFVTSSYASPTLGRPIALGLIERGLSRMGEELEFVHLGNTMRAVVSPVCAFDAAGERLNG